MLCVRSPELIYLLTPSLYPLTNMSPTPPPPPGYLFFLQALPFPCKVILRAQFPS